MPKPTKTDPQSPFFSGIVKGSALVETPNGIARDAGLSTDQLTLGAQTRKGWRTTFEPPVPQRATDDMAKGNRTGE